ncbi:MAG: phosphatidate cytidylyltransferase [Actinobacteria bacterium]|nr:phosphatidate cytidylyltransferase [Actinomycetota bacterium]
MDERDEFDERQRGPRTPAEGVRIIGAEEAQAALEAGHAEGRRPEDAPRYGDVPPAPTGPRPAHRFPLPESVDPSEMLRPPVAAPDMQHWSEPATGEVPRVLGGDTESDDDLEAWSSFTQRAPRWREGDSDWEEADFHDTSALSAETSVGALDTERTEHSDLFTFDEPEPTVVEAAPEPRHVRVGSRNPTGGGDDGGSRGVHLPGARDLPTAIAVGVGLGVVALIAFKLGPVPALVLATAVVTLAAVEAFDVLHRAGYKPARLLGITGTISIMLAAYNYGETALPLVLGLMTITTFLWFLWPVERARATINIAGTLLGFLWVGFLGSFAGLLLAGHSVALLLGPIIATVAYDVGAYFVGSQFGRRPLAPSVSPNKTIEGLAGGAVASIVITTLIVGIVPRIHPWNTGRAFWLGVVVAIAAPLGDLCESMLKRDIGIKDMGTILPGHGGVLDRIDALLFALPAAYYLLRVLH